jgi:hypothetical protein
MKSSFRSLIPFLPLFCSCHFRRLDSVQSPAPRVHIPAGRRPETRLFTSLYSAEHFFIITLQGPYRNHSLYCYGDVFTDPLPSNGCLNVAPVGSRGNVFTESLPSSGSVCHNTNIEEKMEYKFLFSVHT